MQCVWFALSLYGVCRCASSYIRHFVHIFAFSHSVFGGREGPCHFGTDAGSSAKALWVASGLQFCVCLGLVQA